MNLYAASAGDCVRAQWGPSAPAGDLSAAKGAVCVWSAVGAGGLMGVKGAMSVRVPVGAGGLMGARGAMSVGVPVRAFACNLWCFFSCDMVVNLH
jgi:hypothetical protein